MRIRKLTNILLLGYVVTLLTFGQSLHHADIFGFHRHDGDEVGEQVATSTCSCQFHSCQPAAETERFDEKPVESTAHNCAICAFFDDYQVVVHSVQFPVAVEPALLVCQENSYPTVAAMISRVARGPPIA